jgi:hypothetical protein
MKTKMIMTVIGVLVISIYWCVQDRRQACQTAEEPGIPFGACYSPRLLQRCYTADTVPRFHFLLFSVSFISKGCDAICSQCKFADQSKESQLRKIHVSMRGIAMVAHIKQENQELVIEINRQRRIVAELFVVLSSICCDEFGTGLKASGLARSRSRYGACRTLS